MRGSLAIDHGGAQRIGRARRRPLYRAPIGSTPTCANQIRGSVAHGLHASRHGARNAIPSGSVPPAWWRHAGHAFLVDCGSGVTQRLVAAGTTGALSMRSFLRISIRSHRRSLSARHLKLASGRDGDSASLTAGTRRFVDGLLALCKPSSSSASRMRSDLSGGARRRGKRDCRRESFRIADLAVTRSRQSPAGQVCIRLRLPAPAASRIQRRHGFCTALVEAARAPMSWSMNALFTVS